MERDAVRQENGEAPFQKLGTLLFLFFYHGEVDKKRLRATENSISLFFFPHFI